jgi:hypothetical protein
VAGDYQVSVDGIAGCGALTSVITVGSPMPLASAATTDMTTCAVAADGAVSVDVQGGVAPYTYAWSNGATSEDLMAVEAGQYSLTITDANGCQYAMPAVDVIAGQGPVADFDATPNAVMVNDPVEFFNTGSYGLTYTWDFGDGQTSTDTEPTHSYGLPGLYTVTLTVEDGDCVALHTEDVAVSTSTGVTTLSDEGVLAWTEGGQFVVQWQGLSSGRLQVDVLDASGRVLVREQAQGTMGRMTVDGQDLPSGVYLLRLTDGTQQRTVRLPLVR